MSEQRTKFNAIKRRVQQSHMDAYSLPKDERYRPAWEQHLKVLNEIIPELDLLETETQESDETLSIEIAEHKDLRSEDRKTLRLALTEMPLAAATH